MPLPSVIDSVIPRGHADSQPGRKPQQETGSPCATCRTMGVVTGSASSVADPRQQVAEYVAEVVRRRWPTAVLAIGLHGCYGDDDGAGDVRLVVVTYQAAVGPRPATRRIDGVLVDMDVITAKEYLRRARTLSPSWPLTANRYLACYPLYDPDGWHDRLRDTHLARLAEAGCREFVMLARDAWYDAWRLATQAYRLAERYDTDGALLVLGQARIATAVVDGLLTRTYFKNAVDAVRRTGLTRAHIEDVKARLQAQAAELARHGRPVDSSVDELLM